MSVSRVLRSPTGRVLRSPTGRVLRAGSASVPVCGNCLAQPTPAQWSVTISGWTACAGVTGTINGTFLLTNSVDAPCNWNLPSALTLSSATCLAPLGAATIYLIVGAAFHSLRVVNDGSPFAWAAFFGTLTATADFCRDGGTFTNTNLGTTNAGCCSPVTGKVGYGGAVVVVPL